MNVGGAKWDKLQYAKGATGTAREYRGTVAATCKLEDVAMADLRALAFSTTAWDVILDRHRTVSFRNSQFRLIGCFACTITRKHTDIHLNFPFTALLWLKADTPLDEQYDNVVCKDSLGHFLKQWCAYWQIAVSSALAHHGLTWKPSSS